MAEREIISIHIGQAGTQIGDSCWELYCLEHGIQPDGVLSENQAYSNVHTIFSEIQSGKLVPRSVFVDLDPTSLDKIKTGKYRQLFDPNGFVNGREDASNNYARGHYSIGREILDRCLNQIRREANQCESLQGFLFYHSVGGGTGSGFTTNLLERLHTEYDKAAKVSFCVYPSPRFSASVVEPYNAVLATPYLRNFTDVTFMFDNSAMHNIFRTRLKLEQPTLTNFNQLIAQVSSSVTSSMRFEGSINVNLSQFRTNLVPYDRIQFLTCSYAPLVMANAMNENLSVTQMTLEAFKPGNVMASCDPRKGQYISCSLMYRGDVAPIDANIAVLTAKKKQTVEFVDWVPTGIKSAISSKPPSAVPGDLPKVNKSVAMFANTTSVAQLFARVNSKFDLLYSKRGFVHYYCGEGLEEDEMPEAREDLAALEKDYE